MLSGIEIVDDKDTDKHVHSVLEFLLNPHLLDVHVSISFLIIIILRR